MANPISDNDSSDLAEGLIEMEAKGGEAEAFAQMTDRCTAAKIEVQTRKLDDAGVTYTSIAIPSGREKRWVGATGERLERLLAIDFENYVFLQGFEAICCYSKGTIEVGLRGVPVGSFSTIRQLLISAGGNGDERQLVVRPPDGSENRPTYLIGDSSEEYSALAQMPGPLNRLTLTLKGLSIVNHDHAVEVLLKYGNSILFQIDLLINHSFTLQREIIRRFRVARKRSAVAPVQYPNVEYDNSPLSLYWYARSARGMPLLQFLAYYQCIEFYFPTFSKAEARRKIALLLKDPTFRADRDSDVARLLSAISISRSGGMGDERSQLRATISECLNPEELRAFFDDDKARSDFFRGKQKNGVHKIPLANETTDLRDDVADRIYNIRCRIVHTKDSEQHSGGMILPFSDEADTLVFDIELANFLSQKILIATSSLLN